MLRHRSWIALLALVGLVLRAWGITFGLDFDDPGLALFSQLPDEEGCVLVIRDHLFTGDPSLGVFLYWGPLAYWTFAALDGAAAVVLALGQPGGFAAARAALVENPSLLFLIHRLVMVVAGVLTVLVAAGAVRRLAGPRAGLACAALLAVAYAHVRQCHFATVDALMVLFTTLAGAASLRLAHSGERRDALAAGAWVGLAAATKYYGGVAGLCVVAGWWAARRAGRRPPFAVLLLAGVVAGATFLALFPQLPFQWDDLQRSLADQRRHGLRVERLPEVLLYHLRHTLLTGLGESAAVFAVVGGVVAIARRGGGWTLLAVAAIAFLPAVLLNPGAVRYGLLALPWFGALAALAIEAAAVRTRFPGRATLVLTALAVLPSAVRTVAFDRVLARPDTRQDVVRALRAAGATPADVLAFGYVGLPGPSLHHAEPLLQNYLDIVHKLRAATPEDLLAAAPRFLLHERSAPGFDRFGWDRFAALAAERYRVVVDVDARTGGAATDFDGFAGEPAFLVPYTRPWRVTRPGPALRLYERQDDGAPAGGG